jgi:hypothetical protein
VHRRLTKPVAKAIEEISKLEARAQSAGTDTILLHGICVLALSYFEIALSDSLRYCLRYFPHKLKGDEIKFSKGVFIEEQFDLLERSIDKFIMAAAYKSFQDFLREFTETTAVKSAWGKEDQAKVQEFRARRNLLLHNGLLVNDAYRESSGLADPPDKGTHLQIDRTYLQGAITALLNIMTALEKSLTGKYKKYTKLKAARALWAYLFKSPVMPFDDFWHVDEKADSVFATKTSKHESTISGAERLLLGLWRSHFNGDSDLLKGFNMRRFDRANQVKVLYFLTWAPDFSFE